MSKLLIGDKVSTRFGIGTVVDRRSWSDAISDMLDSEAKAFSQDLNARYGSSYQEDYQMLYVQLDVALLDGSRYQWLEVKEVDREQVRKAKGSGK